MHFQFAFKQFKQREGVSGATGETGDHFVVIQATHFLDVTLHHRITQGCLAITTDDDLAVAAYAYNCCHEQTLVKDGKKSPQRLLSQTLRGILRV